MKIADLVVGEVYALGSANSRYITIIGRLLSTENHQGPGYSRFGHRPESNKIVPCPTRPSKYARVDYGLPFVEITSYPSPDQVERLARLDLSKVELKAGPQEIDGLAVHVRLRPANLVRRTYDEHIEVERETARMEKAHRQKQLVEEEARRAIQVRLMAALEDTGISIHYSIYDGNLEFFGDKAVLALLERLEASS